MSEYAERFAEDKIDISVLPDLTDQHLKDLGVALGETPNLAARLQALAEPGVVLIASSTRRLTGGYSSITIGAQ